MTHIFLIILNMSIVSSYVIFVVIAVRLLLRKSPKIYSYLLWFSVIFRLVCPVSFESDFSLVPISKTPVPIYININQKQENYNDNTIPDKLNKDVLSDTNKESATEVNKSAQMKDSVQVEDSDSFNESSQVKESSQIKDSESSGMASQIREQVSNKELVSVKESVIVNLLQNYLKLSTIIWLSGVGILLFYSLFSVLKIKHYLKAATHISDNIYKISNINNAFVFGFFSPKIYLPDGISELEAKYILKHEQVHLKRMDYIIKPFVYFVTCVHWFNPFVWVAFHFMSEDIELSCDESVINKLGSEIKKDYSTSLLTFSANRRILTGYPLKFGENNVKKRIKNVLTYKKPHLFMIIIILVIVIVTGIGLIANSKNQIKINSLSNDKNKTAANNSLSASGIKKESNTLTSKTDTKVLTEIEEFDTEKFDTEDLIDKESHAQTEQLTDKNNKNTLGNTAKINFEDKIDTKDLEQSISYAILSKYAIDGERYEVAGEGHLVLETEEKDGNTYVYIIERYVQFGFENGILTDIGGHSNPAAIIFTKDSNSNYVLKEFNRPLDGSGFLPSMRKMFSKSAYKKYQLMTKEDLKTLNTQAESYAKVYLKQIGRNAEVQIQLDHKYLPEIDDGVSNYLLRAYGDYPYWIGTSEKVKNNIRYVYERAWEDKGNGNGILTLTKRIYQGDIIEKTVIEIIGDKIKCLEGNLKLKEEKYIK